MKSTINTKAGALELIAVPGYVIVNGQAVAADEAQLAACELQRLAERAQALDAKRERVKSHLLSMQIAIREFNQAVALG